MVTVHNSEDGAKYGKVTPYGYTPSRAVGFIFLACFGLSALVHLFQLTRYRLWWILYTICLTGVLELVGWAARTWSSYNVLLILPYLMQLCATIIAPTPLVASNFMILGQIIKRLGSQYSRLSAQWYTRIFLTCDMVSLVVQALGGASASSAVSAGKSAKNGTHLMLGGIIFQLISITFYIILAAEFFLRYLKNKPVRGRGAVPTGCTMDAKMMQMVLALSFSSLCVYIRSWYRTIELANGFNGYIIHTQRYFVILDALMVALAMIVMNVFHPGRLLGPGSKWAEQIPMSDLRTIEAAPSSEYLQEDVDKTPQKYS